MTVPRVSATSAIPLLVDEARGVLVSLLACGGINVIDVNSARDHGGTMRDFTLEQLAQFNGKNGQPAYVAYEGKVYDVSDNPMWDDGDHEATHFAGEDLTVAHDGAPHDVYVTDLPQVGTLV